MGVTAEAGPWVELPAQNDLDRDLAAVLRLSTSDHRSLTTARIVTAGTGCRTLPTPSRYEPTGTSTLRPKTPPNGPYTDFNGTLGTMEEPVSLRCT